MMLQCLLLGGIPKTNSCLRLNFGAGAVGVGLGIDGADCAGTARVSAHGRQPIYGVWAFGAALNLGYHHKASVSDSGRRCSLECQKAYSRNNSQLMCSMTICYCLLCRPYRESMCLINVTSACRGLSRQRCRSCRTLQC